MSKKKEKYWLETSHRILETTMGNGNAKFFPQKKILFTMWRPIVDKDMVIPAPEEFHTMDKAIEFLRNRQMRIKGTQVVKKKVHPFNLVFETLKKQHD